MTGIASVRSGQGQRRGGWVTAAAAVLIVQGGLGLAYLPILGGGDLHPLVLLVLSASVLGLAAGVGLLGLRRWARYAAGATACYSLFWFATTIGDAVTRASWSAFDVMSLAANLFVLFVILRRWPPRVRRTPG